MQIVIQEDCEALLYLQEKFNRTSEVDTLILQQCVHAIRKIAKSIIDELEDIESDYVKINNNKLMDQVKGY